MSNLVVPDNTSTSCTNKYYQDSVLITTYIFYSPRINDKHWMEIESYKYQYYTGKIKPVEKEVQPY